jgi:hypothetical protein
VPGETGFSALGGVQQASTTGGFDLEPPDQGLCAGGGYVVEFINNALAIYDKNGTQLLAPVTSSQVFGQPTTDFFSDPRCYYDAPTRRWFLQEFIVGTVNSAGQEVTPSIQFEAVSNTQDPTGTYTVYSWDTTDASTAHRAEQLPEPGLHLLRRHRSHRAGDPGHPGRRPGGQFHLLCGVRRAELRRLPLG